MLRQHTGLQQMIAAAVIASVMVGTAGMTAQSDIKPRFEAQNLYPRDGDINLAQSPLLRWSAGDAAAFHDVRFGDIEIVARLECIEDTND